LVGQTRFKPGAGMQNEFHLGFIGHQIAGLDESRITVNRLRILVGLIKAVVFVAAIMGGQGNAAPWGSGKAGSQIAQLAGKRGVLLKVAAWLQVTVGLPDALLPQPAFG